MSSAAQAARQRAVEGSLRVAVGLRPEQPTHVGNRREPEVFSKQASAIERRRALLDSGAYAEHQVGVFAREIGRGGVRHYLVDTYAGFILCCAPECDPHNSFRSLNNRLPENAKDPAHLYEVILESQPCWWYFDVEYSRKTNPDLDPDAAAAAFRQTLSGFCRDRLGAELDESSMLEMISSTPDKFSMHAVIKSLRRLGTQQEQPLAFANNAQAGLLVRELMSYARSLRRERPDSCARHLFAVAPPSEAAHAASRPQEVSIIDETVYSRNRCFRLIFNSKFGKQAALRMSAPGQARQHPTAQMLSTMASFVPASTARFVHPLVPPDFGHTAFVSTRPRGDGGDGAGSGGVGLHVAPSEVGDALLQHLMRAWDDMRWANEPRLKAGPTGVASVVQLGGDPRVLAVTLKSNRFCFCKGASHKSNSIFLVVDLDKCVFHQKCHDRGDCGSFYRSPPFDIPQELCRSRRRDGQLDDSAGSAHTPEHGTVTHGDVPRLPISDAPLGAVDGPGLQRPPAPLPPTARPGQRLQSPPQQQAHMQAAQHRIDGLQPCVRQDQAASPPPQRQLCPQHAPQHCGRPPCGSVTVPGNVSAQVGNVACAAAPMQVAQPQRVVLSAAHCARGASHRSSMASATAMAAGHGAHVRQQERSLLHEPLAEGVAGLDPNRARDGATRGFPQQPLRQPQQGHQQPQAGELQLARSPALLQQACPLQHQPSPTGRRVEGVRLASDERRSGHWQAGEQPRREATSERRLMAHPPSPRNLSEASCAEPDPKRGRVERLADTPADAVQGTTPRRTAPPGSGSGATPVLR